MKRYDLTVSDVAQRLGVSAKYVRRLVQRHAIGHRRLPGRRTQIQFCEEDVAAFEESLVVPVQAVHPDRRPRSKAPAVRVLPMPRERVFG